LETSQILFAQESTDKVTQLTAACERKEAKRCSELAFMYMRGTEGVTRDEKSAFAFLQRACDAGDPDGCAGVGTMYFLGKGTTKDERKALEFDQRACDAGSSAGCANLSTYYLRGVVVPRDEKRAVQLAQRSCDADHRCNNLGSDYLNGTGVKRDAKKAAALYERACKAGFVDSCYSLGSLYARGNGVARDDRRALELFQSSCEDANGPDSEACHDAGFMYANGRGATKDEKRAASFYLRACDGDDPLGCFNLGLMYVNGQGVEKDESRAIAFFKRSCDHGHLNGCQNLTYLCRTNASAEGCKKAAEQSTPPSTSPQTQALEGEQATTAKVEENPPPVVSRPKPSAPPSDLRAYLLSSKTIFVRGELGQVVRATRGYLDPNAGRAKDSVTKVLTKWDRYQVLDDSARADLVAVVTESNRVIMGIQEQLRSNLSVYAAGFDSGNEKPLWTGETKEAFTKMPSTKVAEDFCKFVDKLQR
jgi:TPR repeat protein